MNKSLDTRYCPICGHSHPQSLAWLDSNTREFVQWESSDVPMKLGWCPMCRRHIQPMTVEELWAEFAEVPINNDDEIEKPFMCFPAGTYRFDVWHWFDERCPNNLHDDLLYASDKKD